MKIAIGALVVVAIYFIYQYTVGEVFRDYQSCYETAVTELAGLAPSETSVCVVEKLTYDDMNNCVAAVQQQSNFAGLLYEASPTQELIERDLDIHNEACRTNKVEPPKQSYYLSK